jgi:predicted metal-dependent enzyme (double-stranded beta helix superfamily)
MIDVRAWIGSRHRGNGALDHEELARLATDLGTEPRLWRDLVAHDPERRIYHRLHRDQHLDVWLICWCPEQETGLHDHDLSSGAVHVLDGVLLEERLLFGAGLVGRRYAAGETFCFGPTRIHDVRHGGGPPATSIHVYSPPLWRMGMYEVDDAGAISRRPASYLDEIEPAA